MTSSPADIILWLCWVPRVNQLMLELVVDVSAAASGRCSIFTHLESCDCWNAEVLNVTQPAGMQPASCFHTTWASSLRELLFTRTFVRAEQWLVQVLHLCWCDKRYILYHVSHYRNWDSASSAAKDRSFIPYSITQVHQSLDWRFWQASRLWEILICCIFRHVRAEGALTSLEMYKRLDSDAYLEVVMHIWE